jgi:hypothetical protein
MRDEEFKKKLTEVCEWEIPLDPDHNQSGQHNRKKKLEKLGVNCFNQTYPLKIVKLKHPPQSCEDCGKTVEGRTKDITVYRNKTVCGFKEKCVNCGLHKDPYTGEFCLNGTEAAIKWNTYSRGVKKRYTAKTLVQKDQESQVIIRKYPETLDPL